MGQIYTIPKFIKKEIEKLIQNFLGNKKKINSPLGILDTDTQLKSLEPKQIQRLLNRINALWKCLGLNLKLNSNLGLVLFKQKQILRFFLTNKLSKNL